MWKDLNIEQLPRLSRFPFPVKSLGFTHGDIFPERVLYNYEKFEICIRRFSKASTTLEYINEIPYEMKFPHVIVKSPGVAHRFLIDEPRDVVHFIYDPSLEKPLREMLPFPERPIWEISLGEKENQLITELMSLMGQSHEYGITDRIDLIAFQLLEMVIFHENFSMSRPDYYETRIRSIASYFQLHYKDDIDIGELASQYGMSLSTFLRHWRRFFTKTPGQYLLDLKLQEICRILQEEDQYTVQDLTREFGFRESAYFCALFKKKFGMTPLQFRRSSRGRRFGTE